MKKIKRYTLSILMAIISVIVFLSTNAYASPGGIIAKGLAKTPLGKIFIAIITIILLPFIIYLLLRTHIAVSRTTKALEELSKFNNSFRWSTLNERTHAIITHVYSAWRKADVELAKEWMTDWYWQNQKLTVLELWEEEGLKNICNLNKIRSVKPLYIEYTEKENGDGEGSRIVLSVTVYLQDYLVDKVTGKIVDGDRKKKDLETVWTLVLSDGQWKLSLIEEDTQWLFYVKLKNDIKNASEYIGNGLNRI